MYFQNIVFNTTGNDGLRVVKNDLKAEVIFTYIYSCVLLMFGVVSVGFVNSAMRVLGWSIN